MAEGMSDDFRKHFLGTHFFNPPRYLKLLEVIPTADTLSEVVSFVADFCDRKLPARIAERKVQPPDLPRLVGELESEAARQHQIAVAAEGHRFRDGALTVLTIVSVPGPTRCAPERRLASSVTETAFARL